MQGIFRMLLDIHGLSIVEVNQGFLIVPDPLVWKYLPFQKPVRDPIPLEKILKEISQKGRILIRFDQEKIKDQKLLSSLAEMSIKQALEELVSRHKAHLVYHPENHLLEWFQAEEI